MLSVVILAAGMGSRMKSNIPKVLHQICDKSMLEHIIDSALLFSDDINIVLYHGRDEIIEYIEKNYDDSILDKITFHTQHYELYPGTGGALMDRDKNLISLKGDKILILNGDTPLFSSSSMETLINATSSIAVAGFVAKNPSGYGRLIVKEKSSNICTINNIVEEKDCSEEQKSIAEVNGGIYCIQRHILEENLGKLSNDNAQGEYYLPDIIRMCGKQDTIACMYDEDELMGVNTKLHLAKAEFIMLERLRNKAMENGVIMQIPESIYISARAKLVGECKLESGVRILGKSIIESSHIKANTTISDSIINHSDIGPNAHIRPKCAISHSHIGNFVECKSANLLNIKAGHLSYLGDCEIGSGTNVGAGVITCNYDGKTKHKTRIGKNVFIGSDTQIIAPAIIEDNSIIAAGSTITSRVESGSLAISRIKQVNIKGWFYKFFGK